MNSSSIASLNGSAPPKYVRVMIRTRPTSEFASDNIKIHNDLKSISIHIKKPEDGGYINNQQEHWDFKFDGILHNASQENVFEVSTLPIIAGLFEGYNGTILAYGQTGAGKSFTMTGATENYKHRGIIPRAISQVFKEISEQPQLDVTVRVSYLEIYNENMVDLLAGLAEEVEDTNKQKVQNSLNVDEKNGVISVKGLTMLPCASEENALNMFFEGETNRSVAEHQMNKSSSRSHCIFTIYLESRSKVESSERIVYSKLNLVDLAGSERLSKTKNTGAIMKETMYINKSLSFLEQVIIALSDKRRDHIPYRQSRLTYVLRDALGGNCNTLMVGNIRGERDHLEETISTLRFATRMMCVTNAPVVNVQYDPQALVRKYEKEIRVLKQELAMHDTLANRSHVQYESFTESQRFELQKQLRHFLEHDGVDFEVTSVRQIKEIMNLFRSMYRDLSSEFSDYQNRSISGTALPPTGLTSANERFEETKNDVVTSDASQDANAVGESDGFGFGVGVAPSGKGSKNKAPRKGAAATPATTIVVPQVPSTPPSEQIKVQASHAHSSNEQPPDMAISAKNTIPSRAVEFETFKRGKGSEINRLLNDNKVILKEKKQLSKEIATAVNDIKRQIDEITVSLTKRHRERDGKEGDVIIAEEEFKLITDCKTLKKRYREQFEDLKKVRSDIDYCSKIVEQCREKLMSDFETWFESIYGVLVANDTSVPLTVASQGAVEQDDLMDVDEKFDKLQMERILKEDPESYAYHNARRNQERKIQKVVAKSKKGPGKAPEPSTPSRRRSSMGMQM